MDKVNTNKVIRLDGVKKSFKGNILFKNVSLEVEKGQIAGFRGRNGSGKSVLLKIIAGLYTRLMHWMKFHARIYIGLSYSLRTVRKQYC